MNGWQMMTTVTLRVKIVNDTVSLHSYIDQLKIKKDQTTDSRKGYCMWHGIQRTTKREKQKEYGEILDVSGGIG